MSVACVDVGVLFSSIRLRLCPRDERARVRRTPPVLRHATRYLPNECRVPSAECRVPSAECLVRGSPSDVHARLRFADEERGDQLAGTVALALALAVLEIVLAFVVARFADVARRHR